MSALERARKIYLVVSVLAFAFITVGCSNGRGSVDGEQQTNATNFTVGGAVSGLAGSGLILQLNGAADLPVSANGAFSFPTGVANGATYDVTVRTQPSNPAQTCAVSSGAGRVNGGNVTNVAVVCTTGSTSFTVGGTVSGLAGTGLILRNNGTEDLPIGGDGEFIFPTAVATGASYQVTVATQPSNPTQTCSINNDSGVMGSDDVTTVRVVCSTTAFTIGGTVSGLNALGLQLENNGETLAVGANGPFVFRNPVASGASYAVRIVANPAGQSCTPANEQGTVSTGNITDVVITCASDRYSIGGAINGLAAGASVVIRLSAAGEETEQTFTDTKSFILSRLVPSGTGYTIRARGTGHPTQDCTPTAGDAGIVSGANVTNVVITCTTRRFRIGADVRNLQGSGLQLRLAGADTLTIGSPGQHWFTTQQLSGSRYDVQVLTDPANPPQTCTPASPTGVVRDRDVTVIVACALNTYQILASVSGLTAGTRLVLVNNGGEAVETTTDGTIPFPTPIATGSPYNVTIGNPAPAGHSCTVANGSGTVGSDTVTVSVTCQRVYTVGGSVAGLVGSGLGLRNGAVTLAVPGNATSFRLPQSFATGSTYQIEIVSQPTSPSQTCSLANASGTIGNSDVTNVQVSCTTDTFTIGGSVTGLGGFGLQLQLNGGETLTLSLPTTTFTFSTRVPSGQPYNVAVVRQPDPFPFTPQQNCSVTGGGSGTVGAANVTDVSILCQ